MHIAAGYSYLAKRDFRIEPQNPPLIKEFLTLPLFLGYRLPFNPDPQHWRDGDGYLIGLDLVYKSPLPADRVLALSRFPNLFLGGILVALAGWWAYRLWGIRPALLALALASFEPNLVAHSSLVTTDIGVTLFLDSETIQPRRIARRVAPEFQLFSRCTTNLRNYLLRGVFG